MVATRARKSEPDKPKATAKRGRPSFVPSKAQRDEVMGYRANGVRNEMIARRLGIDLNTLTKHFAVELANGKEEMIAAGGGVILQAMLGGDWRAALEWLSRQGGPEWQKSERRLIGGDPHGVPLSVSQMTDEEVAREIAEIERKMALADNPPAKPNGAGASHG